MKKLIVAGILFSSVSAVAEVPSFSPGPGRTIEGPAGSVAVPCQLSKLMPYNETTLVGVCSDKPGLVVIDIENGAKPIALNTYGGKFVDAYQVGDVVWLEVTDGAAPLVLEAREKPAEPSPEVVAVDEKPKVDKPSAPPVLNLNPTARGRVIEVAGRDIVIDLGTKDGFEKGDSVEFIRSSKITLTDEVVEKNDLVAIGRITSINENRAVVDVGINRVIEPGTQVRYSAKAFGRNNFTAPRVPGLELSATVRPFLPLDTLGGAAIIDASAMYRFGGPVAIEARISPFGFAITNQGNAAVLAAHGFLTYDEDLFQVGLGAGVAQFDSPNLDYTSNLAEAPSATEFGFSAAQYIRLGARDGINFIATTNFVVRDEKYEFGGLSASFQLPVSWLLSDSWLILRGGGGLPGHGFGEVGLRTLLMGNGAANSMFVTPAIGYAVIETSTYVKCEYGEAIWCSDQQDFTGPMVGMTVEWRP